MNTERISFKQALRMAVEAEQKESGMDELGIEELVAYAEGDLANEEEVRVLQYLSRDRDEARLLVDYHAFPDLELAEPQEPSKGEVATHWSLLQRRLKETGTEQEAAVPPLPGRWTRRRVGYAIAASISLAILSILLVGRTLQRSAELPEPEINVFVYDLFPSTTDKEFRDDRRDGSEIAASPVLELPGHARSVLLTLNLADLRSFASYRLKVSTARDQILFTLDGLVRGPEGGFTVRVPRDRLRPDHYRADLLGLTVGDEEVLLASYRFELR